MITARLARHPQHRLGSITLLDPRGEAAVPYYLIYGLVGAVTGALAGAFVMGRRARGTGLLVGTAVGAVVAPVGLYFYLARALSLAEQRAAAINAARGVVASAGIDAPAIVGPGL